MGDAGERMSPPHSARVVAVVQARLTSTRLPAKVLLDMGGKPAIAAPLASTISRTMNGRMGAPSWAIVADSDAASRGESVLFQNPAAVRAKPSLSSGSERRLASTGTSKEGASP